jgi:ATP-dependent Clp protease ATP-binding subunit ClpC
VKVPPPSEQDAIKILFGLKDRYEKFHAVGYTDEAIETAVYTSSRYIPDRFQPDKAIDLIDEAGARVKLRQTTLPRDLADIQKRIKFIVQRMENAIANQERSSSTGRRSPPDESSSPFPSFSELKPRTWAWTFTLP